MKKLMTILGFDSRSLMNIRVFNIVFAGTIAVLTIGSWASLFFAACALVAWSDKGRKEDQQ